MFEACQRAQTAHLRSHRHLEWNTALPKEKELGLTSTPPDRPSWFRPHSTLVFEHPSTVLVETTFTCPGSSGKGLGDGSESVIPPRSRRGRPTYTLASQQSETTGHGATMDKSSGVLRTLMLSTAGFFEFLFSDRWKEGCLVRVLPGKLLSNLLHGLVQLEKFHQVIGYHTLVHTRKQSIQPCLKQSDTDRNYSVDSSKERRVLVELEYFCLQEQSIDIEPEFQLSSSGPEEPPSGSQSAVPLHTPSSKSTGLLQELSTPSSTGRPKDHEDSPDPDLSAEVAVCKTVRVSESPESSASVTTDPSTETTVCKSGRNSVDTSSTNATSTDVYETSASSQVIIEDGGDDNRETNQHQEQDFDETIHSSSGDNERCGFPRARCNIRGQTRPPAHTDCHSPLHMIREPFRLRGGRLVSEFPAILDSPPAPTQMVYSWSDRWEDDAFLGPKCRTDDSDIVCLEPVLERYQLQKLSVSSVRKYASAFAKQRAGIKAAQKEERQKRKRKSSRLKRSVSKKCTDDEDEPEEDERPPCTVDPQRVYELKRDVDLMSSELFVDKPETQKKVSPKNKLKKTVQDPQPSDHIHSLTSADGETKETSDLGSGPLKDSKKGKAVSFSGTWKSKRQSSLLQQKKSSDSSPRRGSARRDSSPYTMKRWDKCPDFQYFYYYLKGKNDNKIRSLIEKRKQNHVLDYAEEPSICTGLDKLDHSPQVMKREETQTQVAPVQMGPRQEKIEETSSKTFTKRSQSNNRSFHRKINRAPSKPGQQPSSTTQTTYKELPSSQRQQEQNDPPLSETPEGPCGQECLKSTVKSQNENQDTIRGSPGVQRQKKAKLREGENSLDHDISGSFYLSREQCIQIKDAGLVISDIDPWHIYVPTTSQSENIHDLADTGDGLLQRRAALHRLIEGTKIIVRLNKSRMWSFVRRVPKEHEHRVPLPHLARQKQDIEVKPFDMFKAETGSGKETELCPSGRHVKTKHLCSPPQADIPPVCPSGRHVKTKHLCSPPQADIPPVRQIKQEINLGKKQRAKAKINETSLTPGDLSTNTQNLGAAPPGTNDDTIPNNISEKELWTLMKVGEVFDVCKLKSTYSFEKMFAHRKKTLRRYWQRIVKYRNPETKKKGRQDKSKAAVHVLKSRKDKDMQEKVDSPVPGNWKDFKDTDIITEDFFHQLLLALKLFVVRKERATSANPVQSKVSMTFSRRTAGMLETDISAALQDATCSGHIVAAVCRTLFLDSPRTDRTWQTAADVDD